MELLERVREVASLWFDIFGGKPFQLNVGEEVAVIEGRWQFLGLTDTDRGSAQQMWVRDRGHRISFHVVDPVQKSFREVELVKVPEPELEVIAFGMKTHLERYLVEKEDDERVIEALDTLGEINL